MIEKLKIYISESYNPYINLATEKYLFDNTDANCCTLYLWQNEKTVVIGRNQNPWTECRCTEFEADGGKIARRLSGGGAVFHDVGNLNFTFLCATENYDLKKQMQVIKNACESAGINAEISGRNDILADGKKFSGNAFYNSGGRSYHHGTLMVKADIKAMTKYLSPSKAKLETKGIKSVKSRVVNLSELSPTLNIDKLKSYMVTAFETVYGMKAEKWKKTDEGLINELAGEYSSREYIYGTKIPFTFATQGRFEWGGIEIQIAVSRGEIENIRVYSDSMDWSISRTIEATLFGCFFHKQSITDALKTALPENIANDILGIINI